MDNSLQKGVAAFRAGNREEALKFISSALEQNRDDERAWRWAFNIACNDKERIKCLIQMVRINPKNEKANLLLNELTAPAPLPLEMPVSHQQNSTQRLSNSLKTNSSFAQLRNVFLVSYILIMLLCIYFMFFLK